MNLNIFPDLLTNVEITRIICEILPEAAEIIMKSPRMLNREIDRKDTMLGYSEFERLLQGIAERAFKNTEEKVRIYKL